MMTQFYYQKHTVMLYLITMFILNPLVTHGQATDTLDLWGIQTSISEGNSESLLILADEYLELALIDQPRRYSQSQAFYVLENFFQSFPPKDFELRHTIAQKNQWWVIGRYKIRDERELLRMYLRFTRSSSENHLVSIHVVQIP
ncbi:MAG: DUF4783 domain-containing protein [Bacteroidetes bacterium]|nr:DUF4783 domain-containing protein [Bacteroidota bacterium]